MATVLQHPAASRFPPFRSWTPPRAMGIPELREHVRDSVRRMRGAGLAPERVVIEVKALAATLQRLVSGGGTSLEVGIVRAQALREWMVSCAIEDYYAAEDLTPWRDDR